VAARFFSGVPHPHLLGVPLLRQLRAVGSPAFLFSIPNSGRAQAPERSRFREVKHFVRFNDEPGKDRKESMKNKLRKLAVVGATLAAPLGAFAQSAPPDATSIATNAQTAFNTIAPITIGIVGFYVILRIAKRTVK
jgi:hypothetical protein